MGCGVGELGLNPSSSIDKLGQSFFFFNILTIFFVLIDFLIEV